MKASISNRIHRVVKRRLGKISAINQRYKHGSIKITPAVKLALLFLRLYLILLVCILVYKFVTLL